ncbi:MAG: HD domain-containing phosphohydrolase, partial [Burkholderiaceae bacterium]
LERGALVETDDIKGARGEVFEAPPDELPALWGHCIARAGRALHAIQQPNFKALLDEAVKPLLALVERDPDLAIFQVVRPQTFGDNGAYGIGHSVYAAAAAWLVGRRLGWDRQGVERAFQAALTMNLGMLDLQARLSSQVSPLTALQREAIHEHPIRSVEMLSAAGVHDHEWLEAVLQHHETPDGAGYPHGQTDIGELAEMLRYADVYTARLSSRANRPAMSAAQAGKELHQIAAQSPLAAALIKSFGIFPPGSIVRLATGEVGLVIRNGDKAHRPVISVLTNAAGEPRHSPVVRDSGNEDHAIVALLPAHASPIRLSDERIAALITGI